MAGTKKLRANGTSLRYMLVLVAAGLMIAYAVILAWLVWLDIQQTGELLQEISRAT